MEKLLMLGGKWAREGSNGRGSVASSEVWWQFKPGGTGEGSGTGGERVNSHIFWM